MLKVWYVFEYYKKTMNIMNKNLILKLPLSGKTQKWKFKRKIT